MSLYSIFWPRDLEVLSSRNRDWTHTIGSKSVECVQLSILTAGQPRNSLFMFLKATLFWLWCLILPESCQVLSTWNLPISLCCPGILETAKAGRKCFHPWSFILWGGLGNTHWLSPWVPPAEVLWHFVPSRCLPRGSLLISMASPPFPPG